MRVSEAFRNTVPLARGACTHARRWYSSGLGKSEAFFEGGQETIGLLVVIRQGTADVRAYPRHGPEAPCYFFAFRIAK
jgi:hypothetical protein